MLDLIQRRPEAHAAGSSTSSMQIALFSLGNLCAHAECSEALAALGLDTALAAVLQQHSSPPGGGGSGGSAEEAAVVRRYVARIQQKQAARQMAAMAAAG